MLPVARDRDRSPDRRGRRGDDREHAAVVRAPEGATARDPGDDGRAVGADCGGVPLVGSGRHADSGIERVSAVVADPVGLFRFDLI